MGSEMCIRDRFKVGESINLDLGAIKYSDGIISGSEMNNEIVTKSVSYTHLTLPTSDLV